MNFLLYMLGRAAHAAPGTRPTPRQALLARAAHAAAQNQLPTALKAYRTISQSSHAHTLDILITAHLHLLCGDRLEARLAFADGINRLYQPDADDSPEALCRLLDEADRHLAEGRSAQATLTIRRARALLEVLLAAESGLLLAADTPVADSPLASLAGLSNLTLRLLARAQITENLADSLRRRALRADLATRAAGAETLKLLLSAEESRLAALSRQFPDHAEVHYRLGLLASNAGHATVAAAAFRTVLALHPCHVSSAARLAAADPSVGAAILRQAFFVPAETLRLFATFAAASSDSRHFDQWVARFCAAHPTLNPTAARGNIALALSELALLDDARESWREPATV
jgi:hypothetical protein